MYTRDIIKHFVININLINKNKRNENVINDVNKSRTRFKN